MKYFLKKQTITRIENSFSRLSGNEVSVLRLASDELDRIFCVGQTEQLAGHELRRFGSDVDQNAAHKEVVDSDAAKQK